jgi:splicing factor 3B subunit 3
MTPLSYEYLEQATSFSSTECFEGIIGVKGKELRIIKIERPGDIFTQKIL